MLHVTAAAGQAEQLVQDGLGARPVYSAGAAVGVGLEGDQRHDAALAAVQKVLPGVVDLVPNQGDDHPGRPNTFRHAQFLQRLVQQGGQWGDSPTLSSAMENVRTILLSASASMLSQMKPRFTFQTCRIQSSPPEAAGRRMHRRATRQDGPAQAWMLIGVKRCSLREGPQYVRLLS